MEPLGGDARETRGRHTGHGWNQGHRIDLKELRTNLAMCPTLRREARHREADALGTQDSHGKVAQTRLMSIYCIVANRSALLKFRKTKITK